MNHLHFETWWHFLSYPQLLLFLTFLFSSISKAICVFYLLAFHLCLKDGPRSSFPTFNTIFQPSGRSPAQSLILPDPTSASAQRGTQVRAARLGQVMGSSAHPGWTETFSPVTHKALIPHVYLGLQCFQLQSFQVYNREARDPNCFCLVLAKLQVATYKLQTFKNQATSHFDYKFPASVKKYPWIWQCRPGIWKLHLDQAHGVR